MVLSIPNPITPCFLWVTNILRPPRCVRVTVTVTVLLLQFQLQLQLGNHLAPFYITISMTPLPPSAIYGPATAPAVSQRALLTTPCLLSTHFNKVLCLFYAMPLTVLSCPDSAQGKSTGSRTHYIPRESFRLIFLPSFWQPVFQLFHSALNVQYDFHLI